MFDEIDLSRIEDEKARELIQRLFNLIEKLSADWRDAQGATISLELGEGSSTSYLVLFIHRRDGLAVIQDLKALRGSFFTDHAVLLHGLNQAGGAGITNPQPAL